MNWVALVELLIKSGIAEAVAKLLATLIASLVERLQSEGVDENDLEKAWQIIDSIDRGHQDWDNTTKERYAADAILQYVRDKGRTMRTSTADTITQLTVVNRG